MTRPTFFFDEDPSRDIVSALRGREPTMDILCVGETGVPPKKTKDPDLLLFTESAKRIFVSGDKKTMPDHLANHYAQGKHTYGVVLLKPKHSISRYMDELLLIWGASDRDEWIDRMVYIPQ